MKTPLQQAMELYESHPEMDYNSDFAKHAGCGGYVIVTPHVHILARPIRHNWPPDRISDARQTEPRESADCWFIWLLCGDLKEAAKHLPYPLPWFGFAQRGSPARFVEAEKVLAKIG